MARTSIVACGVSEYSKFVRRSGRPEPMPSLERWVRSVRSECLDHLIVFNEANLRRVLSAYVAYYNRWRPHLRVAKGAANSNCNGEAPCEARLLLLPATMWPRRGPWRVQGLPSYKNARPTTWILISNLQRWTTNLGIARED